MLDSIVRSLRSGERVELRGFGSFGTRQHQPRIARNPKTGVRVEVPEKRVSYFKPSKELTNLVNSAAAPTSLPSAYAARKGEDLRGSVMPTAEEDSDSGQESNGEIEHGLYVATRRNAIPRGSRGALPTC
jgi:integration host factor subunit beta